jgi:hypothetical protein
VQAAPVPAVRPARRLQRGLRGLGEVLCGRGRVGVGGEGEGACAFAAGAVVVVVEGGALNFHASKLGAFWAEGGRCARAGGGDYDGDELDEMHISTTDLEIERSQYLLNAMAEDEFKRANLTVNSILVKCCSFRYV